MSRVLNQRYRKDLVTCATELQQPSPEHCLVTDTLGLGQCCSSWLHSSYLSPGWALPAIQFLYHIIYKFIIEKKEKITLIASMLLEDLFVGVTNGFKLDTSKNSNDNQILI